MLLSLLMPAALFRQTQRPQRIADRLPTLRAAGMGSNKAGDRAPGLQFEPPLSRNLGLVGAAEPGQGGGAQEIGQAEARIGLFRLAADRDRSLPIACCAMSDAESHIRQVYCPVQRAPAKRSFGVFD